jgi:hypothetical protein
MANGMYFAYSKKSKRFNLPIRAAEEKGGSDATHRQYCHVSNRRARIVVVGLSRSKKLMERIAGGHHCKTVRHFACFSLRNRQSFNLPAGIRKQRLI